MLNTLHHRFFRCLRFCGPADSVSLIFLAGPTRQPYAPLRPLQIETATAPPPCPTPAPPLARNAATAEALLRCAHAAPALRAHAGRSRTLLCTRAPPPTSCAAARRRRHHRCISSTCAAHPRASLHLPDLHAHELELCPILSTFCSSAHQVFEELPLGIFFDFFPGSSLNSQGMILSFSACVISLFSFLLYT